MAHLPILSKEISDARLVAVADVDKRRAEAAAKTYGAETWYTDYKELLENPQVKAVWICTPPFLHAQMVIDAAKAGKHVMCEIPMALTLEEADAMIEAAVSFNVLLMAGYHYNFAPAYVKAKELIEQGKIGKPVMIYTKLLFSYDYWGQGKDWIWNAEKAGHPGWITVPKMEFLLNSKIERVCSEGESMIYGEKGNVEDTIAWLQKFDNGVVGLTQYSGIVSEKMVMDTTEIIGEKGIIYIDTEEGLLKLRTNAPPHAKEWNLKPPYGRASIGHFEEDQHFIKCIKKGRKPAMTDEDWKHILKIRLAAVKSRKTGEVIKL